MFRKLITFVVTAYDLVNVIDRFGAQRSIKVIKSREEKTYTISMYCTANDFQRCLSGIMHLSKEGIMIRKLNIKWRI